MSKEKDWRKKKRKKKAKEKKKVKNEKKKPIENSPRTYMDLEILNQIFKHWIFQVGS